MAFFQQDKPKPAPPSDKPKYSQVKKCVMKRESGEVLDDECKNILSKISVDD